LVGLGIDNQQWCGHITPIPWSHLSMTPSYRPGIVPDNSGHAAKRGS